MASLDREDAENEEDNFKSWGVEKLKSYLLEREVPIGNTNKQGLINLAVFARKLGLKAVKSVRESQREVKSERLSKLSLEGRRIILPDPDTLIEGWEDSAFSYPELSQINVEKYWDDNIGNTINQISYYSNGYFQNYLMDSSSHVSGGPFCQFF